MRYAIKSIYPASGEMYAVVYQPWPWPPKTKASDIGWTAMPFDATQFATRAEAQPFLEEIKKTMHPPSMALIVGI